MKKKKELDFDYDRIGHLLAKSQPNFYELSFELPLLLVFLRQLGCAFSHRALFDVRMLQRDIGLEGTEIVLVHMAPVEEADEVFDLYGLNDTLRIHDPDKELYRAFGLKCGKLQKIFNPSIWLNDMTRKALSNDELSIMLGDPLQMPGVFLFHKAKVEKSFIHKSINDRPPYLELARLSSIPEINGLYKKTI